MLILFLSLTLPGLDRRLLAHCEGDAPPRVKEITKRQRNHSGAARRPEQAPMATGENSFSRFHVLPLILYIVFDIVLCHYLLLYIRIVLVFLLISYITFCHYVIPLFVVQSFVCYIEPLGSVGNKVDSYPVHIH